jgi:hypothetical protein
MKHTIEFELPDDREDLRTVMAASEYQIFHDEVMDYLRKIDKYDYLHDMDSVAGALDQVVADIRQLSYDNNLK